MIVYTLYDYFKVYPYVVKQRNCGLSDIHQDYKLEDNGDKKRKQGQKHDKLFREILSRKREIVKLINKYVKPKQDIDEKEIEKYDTKFITNLYLNILME